MCDALVTAELHDVDGADVDRVPARGHADELTCVRADKRDPGDNLVDKYMAEDFIEHEEVPGMDNTRDTPRQLFKMMNAAFTDFHVNVHELFQEGGRRLSRQEASGGLMADYKAQ